MAGWGSDTWEIQRDISVAVFLKDAATEARARQALDMVRAACSHALHPEKPGQCLRCGADIDRPAPGLAKASHLPPPVACRRFIG